jgi:hypothetical protein
MLLVSPLLLFVIGLLVARLSKARRVWTRHSRFSLNMGCLLIPFYTGFNLALLFDHVAFRPIAHLLGAPTGTALFGTGILGYGPAWPIQDPILVSIIILTFMLYPFWFWSGIQSGYWLFGRSPKQTGIIGLLR